jgi:hypothetical protein
MSLLSLLFLSLLVILPLPLPHLDQVLLPIVLDQPLVLTLLLLGLWGQVLRPEAHGFHALRHLGVSRSDCYVLEQVFELLGEGDASEASRAGLGGAAYTGVLLLMA